MNQERSESTKRGIQAERLVRQAVNGQKGVCDVHTALGGFEVRWGTTTKNAAGLNADRARSKAFGGYCVQVSGDVPAGMKLKGDRSLVFFLREHGYTHAEAAAMANTIRAQAGNGTLEPDPDQLELPVKTPRAALDVERPPA